MKRPAQLPSSREGYRPAVSTLFPSGEENSEPPLGTDRYGRDVLIRVFYGCQFALIIGVGVVAIQLLVGVTLGLTAGYFTLSLSKGASRRRSRFDNLSMTGLVFSLHIIMD